MRPLACFGAFLTALEAMTLPPANCGSSGILPVAPDGPFFGIFGQCGRPLATFPAHVVQIGAVAGGHGKGEP